ncbi:ATP-dependent DNA helicase PIF1-like [Hydra vulgaris]|uniref:ATP-dependent DNA helicase n=1 Tax=Hydra vulgaris TaxID=6087 RepID=A0ABM4DHD5_HYDVU
MELTENGLDFLIESIYKFNQNHPQTLEKIRQHAFTSRQTLCQSCRLLFLKYDWDGFLNEEVKRIPFILILMQNNKKVLSLQQQKALQWLDEGINFFITGGAGCGISYTVKEIAQKTGVKTLDYYKRHMHPDIKKTWLETDVLIIDEISMINAQTFDVLHLLACEIKQCYDKLFGGNQVIACSDFFQLPPIKVEFVFKSKIWQQYMTQVLVLTECFRQKEGAQFFGALNEIRFGQVSDQTFNYFMSRCFEKDENLNTKYTRLFFRNMEVNVYNNKKMESIKHEGYWFYAKDVIKNPNIQCSFQIPAAVHLKIGAIVMLLRNINVEEEVKIECVKEEILDCSHAVVGSRLGLPLKLAFSFTVHKAEGNTMNKAVVQFNSKAFNKSLYYVSLSRI